MKGLALGCVLSSLFAAGCAGQRPVTRIAEGTREDGRFIGNAAYSAYALGATLEAAGDLRGARKAYFTAIDADRDSPEILARIGAVSCQLGRTQRKELRLAFEAFDEALELDPTSALAHHERAVCLRALGLRRPALDAALQAFRFDPERVELTGLVADLLFELGRGEEAWAWLDALIAREPDSAQVLRLYHAAAVRAGDPARLRRVRSSERASGDGVTPAPDDGLDAQLRALDLEGARRTAIARRIPAAALAVRAVELGALELGLAQALHVLRADPANSDAFIAALAALEQLKDEERLRALVERRPPDVTAPSKAALALLEGVLARRVGEDAARAFRAAAQRSPEAQAPPAP